MAKKIGKDLNEVGKDLLEEIKVKGSELHALIDKLDPSPAVTVAKTKVNEVMNWVKAHVKSSTPGSEPHSDGG